MKITELLKVLTLGLFASMLVLSTTAIQAQEEHEEEEEEIQTRPNPMDKTMRMNGAERKWDPTHKSRDKGGVMLQAPASKAAPAGTMQTGPQMMQPGMQAPQLQGDGEMLNPQQMGTQVQ